MNRNYQKIIFCFIVASILLIWNSSYAFIYLCGFTLVMIYLVYDINKQNLQQIDFYRQKKENEIREVKVYPMSRTIKLKGIFLMLKI